MVSATLDGREADRRSAAVFAALDECRSYWQLWLVSRCSVGGSSYCLTFGGFLSGASLGFRTLIGLALEFARYSLASRNAVARNLLTTVRGGVVPAKAFVILVWMTEVQVAVKSAKSVVA